jgi:hypothetical protein
MGMYIYIYIYIYIAREKMEMGSLFFVGIEDRQESKIGKHDYVNL